MTIGKRDKRLCDFVLAEKKVLGDFKTKQILSKEIDSISQEEYLELVAAQKILEHN